MDFLKSTKGGPFGSAGGRIPDGGGRRPPLPPNPPLTVDTNPHMSSDFSEIYLNVLPIKPALKIYKLNRL